MGLTKKTTIEIKEYPGEYAVLTIGSRVYRLNLEENVGVSAIDYRGNLGWEPVTGEKFENLKMFWEAYNCL